MLGPERFASFETPNVIDPGDDAPVQPKRKQQEQQSTGESTAAPPRSSRRAPGLGRTEKIDLGGEDYHQARKSSERLINTIDDLDLERALSADDDEYDDENHHSLPSIDEARNYATMLLQDANQGTFSPQKYSRRDLMSAEEPTNILAAEYTTTTTVGSSSKHSMVNSVRPVVTKVVGVAVGLAIFIFVLTRIVA